MKHLSLAALTISAIAVTAVPANAAYHEVKKGASCALGSDLLVGVKADTCKALNARLEAFENGKIVQGCWLMGQHAPGLDEDRCSVLGGSWDWVKP